MTNDGRRHAPAVQRNRGPILDVLRRHVPPDSVVMEVGSGTGEHVAFFAQELGSSIIWQPSDPDPEARKSIDAWVRHFGLANVRPALAHDAAARDWPMVRADIVLCINMIHIAPWAATIGLIEGSARILGPNGRLLLYGPFRQEGRHTSPGNEAFDRSLRQQDRDWGIRDCGEVTALAANANFGAPLIEQMPSNNLCLIFARCKALH